MRKLSILILIVLTVLACWIEIRPQVDAADMKDLSFEKPAGWYEINRDERTANFRKFEFTKEDLVNC